MVPPLYGSKLARPQCAHANVHVKMLRKRHVPNVHTKNVTKKARPHCAHANVYVKMLRKRHVPNVHTAAVTLQLRVVGGGVRVKENARVVYR